ncbi:hypothetical protein PAECIP111891_06656 [Paenibacillus allorhizoplanae]|uniref:Uncharacterized protein n=1 Tax=Paenibacillus allorhizoplanae TaxID=2905648 RepID=A0ABM9D010_9BACL|nr:hypothetical protein PAECIP111891_06656 [Paenibacillus allorhizoplanae]
MGAKTGGGYILLSSAMNRSIDDLRETVLDIQEGYHE